MDANSRIAKSSFESCMMEGFCESCAHKQEQWFNGEYCRIRCVKLGIINRSDIKFRCGDWKDKNSRQQGLFPEDKK